MGKSIGNALRKEDFIERAKAVHGDLYDYSLVDYKNNRTKVTILCQKHGPFEQSYITHIGGKCKCPKCPRYTKDEWVKKAQVVHGERYDYSLIEYVHNKKAVRIVCTKHGPFEQTPNSHLHGNGCRKCKTYTTDEWIEKAVSVHGELYNYSKTVYRSARCKVEIECVLHGKFKQLPSSHIQGCGCPGCDKLPKYTTEAWVNEARKVHGNLYDYSISVYRWNYIKVDIICREHGVFSQIPVNHVLMKQGCPRCAPYGFKRNKPAVFYLYEIEDFIGFGITNNFSNRNRDHRRTFNKFKLNGEPLMITQEYDGETILGLENHIKKTIPLIRTRIPGFMTEALNREHLQDLFEEMKRFLT